MNVNSRQLKLPEDNSPPPNQAMLWKHFSCSSLKEQNDFCLTLIISYIPQVWVD